MVHANRSSRSQRIRAEVERLTAGRQRRYPPTLRRQIAQYARVRLAQGARRYELVGELGVSDPTLVRMLEEDRPEPRLRPVRVVPEREAPASRAPIVVRAPGDIVIEGLDAAGVATLLRALS